MLNIRLWVARLVMMGALLGASGLTIAAEAPCKSAVDRGNAASAGDCQAAKEKRFEGRGGKCVEDEHFMRRNHMNLILHQRDETMHKGIRTSKYSLKGCLECHTATRADGSYIPINDPGQFCESCHHFASVKIDCFECHATTPAVSPASKP